MRCVAPCEEGKLVTSVMLAHCLTAGVPIGHRESFGIMPMTTDWILHLYQWQNGYIDMIRKDLVKIKMWDRSLV